MAKREGKKALRETAKHRAAFLVWYEQGRHFEKTASELRLSNNSLSKWILELDWHERADKLDAKIQAKTDARLISQRVKRQAEMNENHYQIGQGLLSRASEYLKRNELTTAAEAISSAKAGVEIQRKAEGLPDWLIAVAGMNENELLAERDRLLGELANAGHPSEGD